MANFSVDVDLGEVLDGLDQIVEAAKAAVRPAAQAGAQVFYDEVRRRVPVHPFPREDKGRPRPGGTLRAAIYQAYSRDQSSPSQALAVYHISWNKSKASHGHLVEFGHKYPFKVMRTPDGRVFTDKGTPSENPNEIRGRRPFLRPAYDAMASTAVTAARDRLIVEVRERAPVQ